MIPILRYACVECCFFFFILWNIPSKYAQPNTQWQNEKRIKYNEKYNEFNYLLGWTFFQEKFGWV